MSFFDIFIDKQMVRDPYGGPGATRELRTLNPLRVIGAAVGGLLLLILLGMSWPFHSVPTGYRGVVTQFGAIKGIVQEGLVVLPPWQGLSNFSIRAETANIENAEGATSDTQPVHVSLTVRYSISPDKVAEVFEKYSHSGDLSSYVQTATQETFKATTAKYTAPDLISQRSKVSADIRSLLTEKLAIYGAQVINIDMRNFAFQPSYMAAINEKVTQEQKKKLAADNQLKTVESQQKQKVAIAEAEASAAKAKADGEAYATLVNAKAAADALRLQNAAIRESRDVLELKRIEVSKIEAEKWNGQRVPSTQLIVSPTPISGVK